MRLNMVIGAALVAFGAGVPGDAGTGEACGAGGGGESRVGVALEVLAHQAKCVAQQLCPWWQQVAP